ncbi:MAG: hypothetical protein RL334_1593, partial [Chloroflexota bacterium]
TPQAYHSFRFGGFVLRGCGIRFCRIIFRPLSPPKPQHRLFAVC